MRKRVVLILLLNCVRELRGFATCHDDPTFVPYNGLIQELQYTWLGALQYIHVKNGTPHYFRVPRVVLINKEFVLSTALDAAHVPDSYALGNVIFGEYERDEVECGITKEQVEEGQMCDPAVLIMPISDVLIHPEFKHFRMKNSVALMKLILPMKSQYVLPACLPLLDYVRMDESNKNKPKAFYHVDFVNEAPRDFTEEDKDVLTLYLLPKEKCDWLDERANSTKEIRTGCTTGCGLRSGAPTIIHEHTGHWTVVALAQGGPQCADPLLRRDAPLPAKHILLYPYMQWITTAITGKSSTVMLRDDPFGFVMPRAVFHNQMNLGWVGKWWMGSMRCYDRGPTAESIFRYYHEIFHVTPNAWRGASLFYYVEINAPIDVICVCVKVGVAYKLAEPTVWGIDTGNVKLRVVIRNFHRKYSFQVEAWGFKKGRALTHSEAQFDPDYSPEGPSGEKT